MVLIEVGKEYRTSLGYTVEIEESYTVGGNKKFKGVVEDDGISTLIFISDGSSDDEYTKENAGDIISIISENDELKSTQNERESNYGKLIDHSIAVENIMFELKDLHKKKNKGKDQMPPGFETTLFYLVSKLARMSTDPLHEDSALDLSNYAKLWLEQGIRNEK